YRRRRPRPFLVRDDGWFAPLHHGHHRVGRAQVNTYNLAHKIAPSAFRSPRSVTVPAKASAIIHVECFIVKLSMRPYAIVPIDFVAFQRQIQLPPSGAGTLVYPESRRACAPLTRALSYRQPNSPAHSRSKSNQ